MRTQRCLFAVFAVLAACGDRRDPAMAELAGELRALRLALAQQDRAAPAAGETSALTQRLAEVELQLQAQQQRQRAFEAEVVAGIDRATARVDDLLLRLGGKPSVDAAPAPTSAETSTSRAPLPTSPAAPPTKPPIVNVPAQPPAAASLRSPSAPAAPFAAAVAELPLARGGTRWWWGLLGLVGAVLAGVLLRREWRAAEVPGDAQPVDDGVPTPSIAAFEALAAADGAPSQAPNSAAAHLVAAGPTPPERLTGPLPAATRWLQALAGEPHVLRAPAPELLRHGEACEVRYWLPPEVSAAERVRIRERVRRAAS